MAFASASDLASLVEDTSLNGVRGDLILEQASNVIRHYCLQTFDLVTDDAVELRGTSRYRLLLPERPVVSVASVTLNGDLLASDSYSRVRDGLWRSGGWGGPDVLVEVTYTHGWATLPPILETVCLQVAARGAANPQSLGQFSADTITLGGLNEQGPFALTAAEMSMLSRFRHELATKL